MAESNPNSRLEAFCDGVFAIALTLLIIEVGIPSTVKVESEANLWHAIKEILPLIFSFLLSFVIIFITWANHHASLKLVHKSSGGFLYANGLLLLTVVFIPFPTALLGEHILTDHAAPAVVLYNALLAVNAIAWVVLSRAAVKGRLTRSEKGQALMRMNVRNGFYAFTLYSALAILAFWFPHIIAAITTLTWAYWLVYGIRGISSDS